MKKIVFFVLFVFVNIHAQKDNFNIENKTFDIGFLAEVTILNSNMEYLNVAKKDSSLNNIYPVSLFLSGRVYLTNNLCLEFRPGFIWGGEYYTGIEYGFYLRYYFNRYYIISGVNFHDNFGGTHGLSHYVEVFDNTATLINVSLGYKMSDNLGFSLSYYHPLSEYKMSRVSMLYITDSQSVKYNVKLENIFKVGFDYTF